MDRRDFLKINSLALGSALCPISSSFANNLPFNIGGPKAKTIILLTMVGGPSQIETFDYKPALVKNHGKRIGGFKDERGQTEAPLMKPLVPFQQYGESGAWVSSLFPNMAKLVDDLTFLKAVKNSSKNHYISQLEFNTGSLFEGSPFSGAWINYALKGKLAKLPNMVVMKDPLGNPRIGREGWNSHNIPYGNSKIVFDSIDNFSNQLKNIIYEKKKDHSRFLKQLNNMNQLQFPDLLNKGDFKARSDLFDLTYQMKDELERIVSLEAVSEEEKKLYGLDEKISQNLGNQLLVARKLVEKGVRFIQVYCGNEEDPTSWDHHFNINDIENMAKKIDRPIYGFMTDLKRRGLLDQSIVYWGGEFGRLPVVDEGEAKSKGRGHNNLANTIWLAGAGLKKGMSFGETDEISMKGVKDIVEIGDVWATMLHLLGIDHRELFYHINGMEKRFTKRSNRIIHEILS